MRQHSCRHAQLVDFAFKNKGYKSWSIIYDTTSYGDSCSKTMQKALEKAGGKVLSVDGVPVGTQDFRPILSRLKTLDPSPQAVYFGGVVSEAALLRLQMLEMGMDNYLYAGVTGFDSETFNKTAGKAAEGTLIIGKKAIGKESDFVKAYEQAGYKAYYEATGPYAYDATNLIIAAINKVGPKDKKLLAKTLRGMDYNGILGNTRFDEFGQTETGGLTLKVSQAGHWFPWDSSDYAAGKLNLPQK